MRSLVTPLISGLWSHDGYIAYQQKRAEAKLNKQNRLRHIDVFVALDDPHSYVLLKVLPKFCQDFELKAHIHLVHHRQADMFPEEVMWSKWAMQDATDLAHLYQLYLPPNYPQHSQIRLAQSYWAQNIPQTPRQALQHFDQLWLDQGIPACNASAQPMLRANEQRLKNLGHYLPASIYYGEQWYWGLDRLEHLESRLMSLGLHTPDYQGGQYQRTWENFCHKPANVVREKHLPIELFFSMRSPYSHIALKRCHKLAEHYGIPLKIKPVMPMLMRQMAVPKNKTRYIFFDAVRESKKLNIPYGKVADPLGKGVENTYAIWHFANQQGKGNAFLLAISHLVNAQGVSANFHNGLKQACQQIGLSWSEAKQALSRSAWRDEVQRNLNQLYEYGLWGVPSIHYQGTQVWGQDRIWCIENALVASQAATPESSSLQDQTS